MPSAFGRPDGSAEGIPLGDFARHDIGRGLPQNDYEGRVAKII